MIVFTKRLRRKLSPAILLITVIAISLSLLLGKINSQEAVAKDRKAPVLVIDPGHGGIDGGALGIDGTKESDLNLEISLRLRAIAEFYGKDNLMTRDSDVTLSTAGSYSEHSDLTHRLAVAQSIPGAILISIHQNSYPTSQASGSQVIYSASDGSERLGKLTHANLISALDPSNRRVAEPATSRVYILANAGMPAILVECGFVSSFSDISKLKDITYQTKLGAVIFASYIQFIESTDSQTV